MTYAETIKKYATLKKLQEEKAPPAKVSAVKKKLEKESGAPKRRKRGEDHD